MASHIYKGSALFGSARASDSSELDRNGVTTVKAEEKGAFVMGIKFSIYVAWRALDLAKLADRKGGVVNKLTWQIMRKIKQDSSAQSEWVLLCLPRYARDQEFFLLTPMVVFIKMQTVKMLADVAKIYVRNFACHIYLNSF